ncbi:MAG: lipoprotein [Pseudomonadota bacterium]|nr:lipoprotein [Pseudomonadota bacterium]
MMPAIRPRTLAVLLCALCCVIVLSACGQTGALYLPDPAEEPRRKP